MRVAAIMLVITAAYMLASCSPPKRDTTTDLAYIPDKQTIFALEKSPGLKFYRDDAVQTCRNALSVSTPRASEVSINNFCKCAIDTGMKGKSLEELTAPGFQEDIPEECTRRYGPQSK
jgi:hypothetical protein